jgi:small subunit ribosomal protein S6
MGSTDTMIQLSAAKERKETMMRTYEVAGVVNPEMSDAEIERLGHSLKAVITKLEGKVTEENVWGRKPTAYPVAGNNEAHYAFYTVEMPGKSVAELENTLKLTEGVLRHLITLKEE